MCSEVKLISARTDIGIAGNVKSISITKKIIVENEGNMKKNDAKKTRTKLDGEMHKLYSDMTLLA